MVRNVVVVRGTVFCTVTVRVTGTLTLRVTVVVRGLLLTVTVWLTTFVTVTVFCWVMTWVCVAPAAFLSLCLYMYWGGSCLTIFTVTGLVGGVTWCTPAG